MVVLLLDRPGRTNYRYPGVDKQLQWGKWYNGKEVMGLLLGRREEEIISAEEVVNGALNNEKSEVYVMNLLSLRSEFIS